MVCTAGSRRFDAPRRSEKPPLGEVEADEEETTEKRNVLSFEPGLVRSRYRPSRYPIGRRGERKRRGVGSLASALVPSPMQMRGEDACVRSLARVGGATILLCCANNFMCLSPSSFGIHVEFRRARVELSRVRLGSTVV